MRKMNKLTPIVQTHRTCGQACVAMIAGVTLEEAIVATGKTSRTRTADLKRGLDVFGIPHGDKLIRYRKGNPLPTVCI